MLWIVSGTIFLLLVGVMYASKKWGQRDAEGDAAEEFADAVNDAHSIRDDVDTLEHDELVDELFDDDDKRV